MKAGLPPEHGKGRRVGDGPAESLKEIFLDVAAGRREAVERLYDAAADRLYGLALWRTGSPEDAGEVVQEVFVRVAERRERLAGVRDPEGWLLTVAHRLAIDVLRRRKRRPTESLDACPFLVAAGADADRTLDAGRVSAFLAELPPSQRETVYLHHYADCTFEAIGRITGVPTFTAASRYRLALEKLRKILGAER